MLLLGWSHCYKNSTVVITIWLTVTKYPYLKWQQIFYFLHRCFVSSITAKTFTGLDCIHELHSGLLIRRVNCLPFTSTWLHPRLFDEVRVAHLFCFFVVVLLFVFTFWVTCDVRYDFRIKNDVRFVFTSSCLYEGSCLFFTLFVLCVSGLSTFNFPFGIL